MATNAGLLQHLLSDPCGLFVAALMFLVIGHQASAGREKLRQAGAALAGAALLAIFAYGLSCHLDMVGNALGSVGLGHFVLGVSWIVLPLVAFVVQFFRALVPAPRAEPERPPPEPETAREEVTPMPAPLPPPPPTQEERQAAARERYDQKLRMLDAAGLDETELAAARVKAKQQYLRDLDDVMQ